MSINVIKEKTNNYGSEFSIISDSGDKFKIHYAGGDLYWTMVDYHKDNEFVVSKNDMIFYKELENIFDLIGDNVSCLEWASEAYGEIEDANKLFITKLDDGYHIKFFQNPNRLFNRKDICPICFCLSGSNYQNIANEFSMMFYRISSNYKNRKNDLGLK